MALRPCPNQPCAGRYEDQQRPVKCSKGHSIKFYCQGPLCGYILRTTAPDCENPNCNYLNSVPNPPARADDHCHCPWCGIDLFDKRYKCWNCGASFKYLCPICRQVEVASVATSCPQPPGCGGNFSTVCPDLKSPPP